MLSSDATLIDVAFAVCTALNTAGERALLVGGSAATFYAPEAYQSNDCDFILSLDLDARSVVATLSDIGFVRTAEGFLRVSLDVARAQCAQTDYAAIAAWTDRELFEAPAAYDVVRRDLFQAELRTIVEAR